MPTTSAEPIIRSSGRRSVRGRAERASSRAGSGPAAAARPAAVPDHHPGPVPEVVLVLRRHPEQLAALRADPDLLDGAIDEELRRPFRSAGPWIDAFLAEPSLRASAFGWLVPDPEAPDEPAPGGPGPGMPVEELSERERDVLERLARAMSTEDIAADLYVSVNTVKTHLKSVYRKLSVHRRNDAVRRARELGLL
ncbi:LuxR C-terminal-related transcriptional regulator [Streptomyces tanashiensis]|uniref:helix-turn-helix transcriptional regulator n=1 Tax=Streptomyces tanashiensis TaxID=67367 RepID=UPI003F4D589D